MQQRINTITELDKKADAAFKRLQELNATEGTGKRWCSAQLNAIELLKSGKDYMWIYENYVTARAKIDALTDVGCDLASVGFWK